MVEQTRCRRTRKGQTFRQTGVELLSFTGLLFLVVSCGTEELEPPPAASVAASTQEVAPPAQTGSVQPGVQGENSGQLADVYANLTPEQQAQLGPNLTQQQYVAMVQQQQAAAVAATEAISEETLAAYDNVNDNGLGRLNMEAIQQAFDQATDMENFELRVNQVYEGDHVLLVRVENDGTETTTEAWEDLDDTGDISENNDDLVFSLAFQNQTRTARLAGHGVNSYYTHDYPVTYTPTGPFWNTYLLPALVTPRVVYVTPRPRRVVIHRTVRTYRTTPAWVAHQRATRAYYQRMRTTNPYWAPAVVTIAPARRSYRVRRGRPLPPPPRVHVTVPRPPRPPRVHINVPRPPAPRVHISAPVAPRVRVHAPPPPRVKVHGRPRGPRPVKAHGHPRGPRPAKVHGHPRGPRPAKAHGRPRGPRPAKAHGRPRGPRPGKRRGHR